MAKKHAFWHTDPPDRSKNATCARAEESKRKRKKNEKKLRDL